MGLMFDFKRFLQEKFQTPSGLLALLNAYQAPAPSLSSVEKWFQRASVPADWFAVILAYLELDEGMPTKLQPYLEAKT